MGLLTPYLPQNGPGQTYRNPVFISSLELVQGQLNLSGCITIQHRQSYIVYTDCPPTRDRPSVGYPSLSYCRLAWVLVRDEGKNPKARRYRRSFSGLEYWHIFGEGSGGFLDMRGCLPRRKRVPGRPRGRSYWLVGGAGTGSRRYPCVICHARNLSMHSRSDKLS